MNVVKKSRTFFLYPSPSAALQQSPYHKRERERNGSAESEPANSSSSKDPHMGYLLLIVLGMIMVDRCKTFVAEGAQWQPATAIYSRERNGSAINEGEWKSATATYTKETNGPIINEGACGYGDLHRASYGVYSAGLSTMLFNRGSTCGACFELRCVDHIRWCLPGSPTVILTATDFCPPNYGLSADYGGWCNFPQEHFEMSEAAFADIAERAADIVPVQYRRVKCGRSGGLRFTIAGNSHYYQVLVTNVGSDGEVMAVKVKGSKTGWIPMARNWGQNWQCNVNLKGQPLSFEVTTSDKMTLTAYNVAPANWQFGQTFEGKQF